MALVRLMRELKEITNDAIADCSARVIDEKDMLN